MKTPHPMIVSLSVLFGVEKKLEPSHGAMLSVQNVQPNPQALSTNRHVLQGWVDLA